MNNEELILQMLGKISDKLEEHDKHFESIDNHFESIDNQFESIDNHFESIDNQFESIDNRFESIDNHFDSIDNRFESIDNHFESIDNRFGSIDNRFESLETDVRHTRMLIEKQEHNVQLIAEQYGYISAKLERVREIDELRDRVRTLETVVRNHTVSIKELRKAE